MCVGFEWTHIGSMAGGSQRWTNGVPHISRAPQLQLRRPTRSTATLRIAVASVSQRAAGAELRSSVSRNQVGFRPQFQRLSAKWTYGKSSATRMVRKNTPVQRSSVRVLDRLGDDVLEDLELAGRS